MAKSTLPDPRAEAAAELSRVEADREKMLPQARKQVESAEMKFTASRKTFDEAAKELQRCRRGLSALQHQLDTRETTAKAVLAATADQRVAEFIDEVQYAVSTRRNEFFGATPEGMQRWALAIQRACDEARALQCSPEDDHKTTALLAKWRADIEVAEARIAERSGKTVSVGDDLSEAVKTAVPVQRTKNKHGDRYRELD